MTEAFLSGAICMGFFVAALFFVRFWRRTRDRLFLFFAAAFLLLLTERLLRDAFNVRTEWEPAGYLPRLAAYILIIVAVIDKNRRP